jgi:hypothetical protein
MFLNGPQTTELVDAIAGVLLPDALDLLAQDLGIDLDKEGAPHSLKERAFVLILALGKPVPPRHADLLERLSHHPNAILRNKAMELLRPSYFPGGDPRNAILLGRKSFYARPGLRDRVSEFLNPSSLSSRILIVSGQGPGGKSYSYEFLHHLAGTIGARALRLRLKGTNYTPREFLEQVYQLLRFDPSTIRTRVDNPQLTKIDYMINGFKGLLSTLTNRMWLIVDDLNEPDVTPEVRGAAYAVAAAVEELKPDNLWIVLLGYNETIVDPDLRYLRPEVAEFPRPDLVARDFMLISQHTSNPLTDERSLEIATVLFSKFPTIDKNAMFQLADDVHTIGEKLMQGVHP